MAAVKPKSLRWGALGKSWTTYTSWRSITDTLSLSSLGTIPARLFPTQKTKLFYIHLKPLWARSWISVVEDDHKKKEVFSMNFEMQDCPWRTSVCSFTRFSLCLFSPLWGCRASGVLIRERRPPQWWRLRQHAVSPCGKQCDFTVSCVQSVSIVMVCAFFSF